MDAFVRGSGGFRRPQDGEAMIPQILATKWVEGTIYTLLTGACIPVPPEISKDMSQNNKKKSKYRTTI